MEDFYVPAIDGVPGIMPGNVKVPPPPEFEEEEIETAQPQDQESSSTESEQHSQAPASYDAMGQSGKKRQVNLFQLSKNRIGNSGSVFSKNKKRLSYLESLL